jgi:hypothetical protein
MPYMFLAPLAVAPRSSAVFLDFDQAGGQNGTGGSEFLHSGVKHSSNEGVVFRDFHGLPPWYRWFYRNSITTYPKYARKKMVRRKLFSGSIGQSLPERLIPTGKTPQKVRKISYSSELRQFGRRGDSDAENPLLPPA